ncbi:MAG TPA: OmpH family outer membrane protein [Chlamydiales bacterium]|nr:OmpH family outer membrane protein [Chlamydiales bacterium]
MKKQAKWLCSGFVLAIAVGCALGAAPQQSTNGAGKIAIVSFKDCLDASDFGKTEQKRFDDMKKEMEKTLETKEKELNEMAPKFKSEFLETLTPEAEAELKEKFKKLSTEFSQMQNQYGQILQQANYQIVGHLSQMIDEAAAKVGKEKGIDLILNKEACFFVADGLDFTSDIVRELNAIAAKEKKEAVKQDDKKSAIAPLKK